MKKILALVLALMLCMSAAAFAAAPSPEETGGIAEIEIGETEIEWLLVAGVYFQPVVMEPASEAGLTVEEANIHIEADISANENNLGYGQGYKYNPAYSEPVEQEYLPQQLRGVDFFKQRRC